MIIFAKKHFSAKNARYSVSLSTLPFISGLSGYIEPFLSKDSLPIIDAILLFGGIIGIKNYWEHNVIFPDGGEYPIEIVSIAIPFIFSSGYSVFF